MIFFDKQRAGGRAQKLIALCEALLSERGEVSGARLAAEALGLYRALDARGLDTFFDRLASHFSPDRERLQVAAAAYAADPSEEALVGLQRAVESPRQELFRRLNMAPGGIRTLIEMRGRLLPTLKEHRDRVNVDADHAHQFRSWFNRGFQELRRIDWRTPAVILERLIEYEAVHQIQGWRDLRRRLEADRRCYAFFHPTLPEEPLIFIEAALTRGIAPQVQPLIDPESPVGDPVRADSAIFYSITNCQEGLRGISFGNYLIKQVVEDLGREFPRLRNFSTLSPIPGFRAWLTSMDGQWASVDVATASPDTERQLMALCARYLLEARRGREPLDPVERFHLANGASLERLNWMADTSAAGVQRSLGLMANYRYELESLERNHEAYATEYRVVASRAIQRLAKGADRSAT
jgi:malonyl-CoA decarboxylase